MMGVSVSTIRRRMSALGLSVRGYYSNLSDSELDEIVRSIQWQYHVWEPANAWSFAKYGSSYPAGMDKRFSEAN